MDVVYAVVEGSFANIPPPPTYFLITPFLCLQFFIPIIAVIVLLAVLYHYKGRLVDEDGILGGGEAEIAEDENREGG